MTFLLAYLNVNFNICLWSMNMHIFMNTLGKWSILNVRYLWLHICIHR